MQRQPYSDKHDRYWITEPPDELGPAIRHRYDRYIEELHRRGRLARIAEADQSYYAEGTPSVSFGGEQSELTLVRVNHFRSLVTGVLSMTTSQRVAFECTAADDSSEAAEHVHLAQQILDYHLDSGLERQVVDAAKRMLLHAEGGLFVGWDATAGEVIAAEPGEQTGVDDTGAPIYGPDTPVHEGDLLIRVLSPYDVARDIAAKDLLSLPWVIVRVPVMRWDLLARYPEAREEILSAPDCFHDDTSVGLALGQGMAPHTSDHVYVHELYAERSPAVPEGRYARTIGSKYLEGGPLPYKRLPVVLRSPDPVHDRALGSSQTWDLLGVQSLIDGAESSIATLAESMGKGNLLVPRASNMEIVPASGGIQEISYDASVDSPPPAALELPRVSSDDIAYVDHLRQQAQLLIGINDVVRGDPGGNTKSGVSQAMMQAVSVQYMSSFQSAYADLPREAAQRIIECYQAFATSERVAEVSGVEDRRSVTTFTGADLSKVRTVSVQLGNALMRTLSGKLELAEKLIDPAKWPTDPPLTRAQYLAFVTTGRYEPMMRAPLSSELGIRAECEALARGEDVAVLMTDNHAAHIREHAALLDGRARMQLTPDVIARISEHITEHQSQWGMLTATNPALLMATGQQPMPMPMMPGAPVGPDGAPMAGPPGAPPPGPGAPPGGGPPQGEPPPMPGAGPAPRELPGLPQVPGTGEPPPMQGAAA